MHLRTLSFAIFCVLASLPRLRGQASEIPGTAAKGGLLIESDLLSWSHENHTEERDGYHATNIGFGDILLSTGLADRLDIQFGYSGWLHERAGHPELMENHSYRGDVCVRSKWAFWGEDGKTLSFSLLPYLSWSIHSGGHSTHGLILPWSLPLSESWTLGGQAAFERHGDDTGAWQSDVYGNLYLSRQLNPRWSVYSELRSFMPCRSPRSVVDECGLGLVYAATDKLSLELEGFVGLQRRAPDSSLIFRVAWSL